MYTIRRIDKITSTAAYQTHRKKEAIVLVVAVVVPTSISGYQTMSPYT